MRGAHHVKNWWEKPFFCEGCKREHGPKIDRFEIDEAGATLDAALANRGADYLPNAGKGVESN